MGEPTEPAQESAFRNAPDILPLTLEKGMKVADFVEKLNAFAIVYLIGGIVGPVVIAVFSVVGSAGVGGMMVDQSMLLFMVLVIFPLVMVMITWVVKLMEPRV